MSRWVYVDASFFIAYLHPDDDFHDVAKRQLSAVSKRGARLLTTDLVLAELLNFFAKRNQKLRQLAIDTVGDAVDRHLYHVVFARRGGFRRAVDVHAEAKWTRRDRPGLTDAFGIHVMRHYGIGEALAGDRCFVAAGFKALLLE